MIYSVFILQYLTVIVNSHSCSAAKSNAHERKYYIINNSINYQVPIYTCRVSLYIFKVFKYL